MWKQVSGKNKNVNFAHFEEFFNVWIRSEKNPLNDNLKEGNSILVDNFLSEYLKEREAIKKIKDLQNILEEVKKDEEKYYWEGAAPRKAFLETLLNLTVKAGNACSDISHLIKNEAIRREITSIQKQIEQSVDTYQQSERQKLETEARKKKMPSEGDEVGNGRNLILEQKNDLEYLEFLEKQRGEKPKETLEVIHKAIEKIQLMLNALKKSGEESLEVNLFVESLEKILKDLKEMSNRNFVDTSLQDRLKAKGFNIIETIGEGSFGKVIKATKGSKTYAVKIFKEMPVPRTEWWGYQRGEVNSRIKNKGIINVKEVIHTQKGIGALIFDYVDAKDLEQHCRDKQITLEDTKKYGSEILETLKDLHQQGIAHKDIKLENILIDQNTKEAKLIDFGLSENVSLEESNTISGSELYLAPELWAEKPHGTAVDMWAFGTMLYILLTGDWKAPMLLSRKVLTKITKRDSFKKLQATPGAQELILGLLEEDPSKRWTAEKALKSDFFKS